MRTKLFQMRTVSIKKTTHLHRQVAKYIISYYKNKILTKKMTSNKHDYEKIKI